MAKRVAQIVLPKFDNDGNSLTWQHDTYQKAFCKLYGGFTAYAVTGGWLDDAGKLYQDESVCYHIAMDDDETTSTTFKALAYAACSEFKQLAVMIVLPSGNVEFVS